jgi:hypothetical protein
VFNRSQAFFGGQVSKIYIVGGSGSLGGTTRLDAGFLRRVKKPTRIGIRININAKQSAKIPYHTGRGPYPEAPLISELKGVPAAISTPKMQATRPGQPHSKTAAMVAIIATVRFSIIDSLLNKNSK